jgi:hypothetical protein
MQSTIIDLNARRRASAQADQAARDARLSQAARQIAAGLRLAGRDGPALTKAVLSRLR